MKKNFQLIIFLLMITVVAFVFYNISVVDQEIKENQYNSLVNDLGQVSRAFELWINDKKTVVNTSKDIVDNLEYTELVRYATGNPYLNINNDDPDISQIYIGLDSGGFITGGQWIPPSDYDPRTRTWYKEAKSADETIISKVYVDRETGEKLVTISAPLYMQGEFVGVISADVFLEQINKFLVAKMKDVNNYAYLVDDDGTIIIHTSRDALVGKSLYTDVQEPVIIEYFEIAKETSSLVRMEYVYKNQEIRGIMQKAIGRDWYIAVALVNENSFFYLWDIEKRHMIINGFSLVFILMLIWLLIRIKSELNDLHLSLTKENEKDFLTGIYNRRYLNIYLDRLWKDQESIRKVNFLMMDVDNFKKYNDSYGHLLGDEVLKKITDCVSMNIRKSDMFARFGGEEFCLIIEDASLESAASVAEKIRKEVYDLDIEHKESDYKKVTISIGVVSIEDTSKISIYEMIENADEALYKAKQKGRNSVVVSTLSK